MLLAEPSTFPPLLSSTIPSLFSLCGCTVHSLPLARYVFCCPVYLLNSLTEQKTVNLIFAAIFSGMLGSWGASGCVQAHRRGCGREQCCGAGAEGWSGAQPLAQLYHICTSRVQCGITNTNEIIAFLRRNGIMKKTS